MTGCSSVSNNSLTPIKVEIVQTESGFQLMRDGSPYSIKGAGMAIDDIEVFAAHGGNSIRNWTTASEHQDVQDLLDVAHANGVTVALCLPMKAERSGFDYNDTTAIAAQLEAFRQEVVKYRDHPALLFWIIGNELNHSYTNPAVYDAVNDVATMIHSLDPNHPTTTTVSEVENDLLREISTRAPALDFVSFQLYGKLFGLRDAIVEIGFDEPFMVTEWGAIGYWEMEQTSWGVPIEMTSSEKAGMFLRGHQEVLDALRGQLIGSYVFLWGQKQERTPTWFGMFTEAGEETETVDAMHYIWSGSWPANRSPRLNSMLLDGKNARQNVILSAGERYEAKVDLFDYENDSLRFRWEVKPESDATQAGGDFEEPISNLAGVVAEPAAAATSIIAPAPGQYRLFAYGYDDHGHAAHANIPFLVSGSSGQ
jgi:hypothetical protein